MNPTERSLLELARQVSKDAPLSSPRGRQLLESALTPIIRVALRTGHGPEALVRWVRHQVPAQAWPVDPARAAPPLARELCDRLVQRLDPLAGRETIVGL